MNDRFNNAVGPQVRAPKSGTGKTIPALAEVLTLAGGLQSRRRKSWSVTWGRGKNFPMPCARSQSPTGC